MTLLVETGSGSSASESLASIAYADTYLAERGYTAWAALLTAAKEQALRKATDYLEQKYSLAWEGVRKTTSQALSWPRAYVPQPQTLSGELFWPDDEIPAGVIRACCLLAYRASTETLLPDQDRETDREKIGPIEIEYSSGGTVEKRYREIELILSPFIKLYWLRSSVRVERS